MKKLIYILTLIAFAKAQNNLVPNPSFEDTAQCPDQQGAGYAPPWETPTLGTPDLFHSCNSGVGWNWNVSTPQNFTGYQQPKTGQAYYGLGVFPGSREYIETNLIDTLKAGKKYCFKFYLSLGDSCNYAINKFGAHFRGTKFIDYTNGNPLPFIPQVSYLGGILSDSINWIEIKDEFTAIGDEYWLIIGNFFPDSLTTSDTINKVNYEAYYYIDDVSVYESAEANAGKDTFICNIGDSVQLGIPGRADIAYSWQPLTGLSNPTISNPKASPLIATNYTLTVTDTNALACNSVLYDTVLVYISCTGIPEMSKTAVLDIYPNPADNILHIHSPIEETTEIQLQDISGKLLQRILPAGKTNQLDISGLQPGMYFIRLSSGGKAWTRKFVKG